MMFDFLWASHPIELMVVQMAFGLPLMFLAFTTAARVQREYQASARFGVGLERKYVAYGLSASILFGYCVFMERLMVTGYMNANGYEKVFGLPDWIGVALGASTAGLAIFIPRSAVRALVSLSGAVLFVVLFEALVSPFQRAAGDLETFLFFTVASVASLILITAAGYLMTTPSYVARGVAVVCSVWGIKLMTFGVLAIDAPGLSVFASLEGTITPMALIVFSALIVAAAGVAYAEARRLQSDQFHTDLLADSEERMRLLAEAAQEAIVVTRDGLVEDANKVFRTLSGQTMPVGVRLSRILPCLDTPECCDGAATLAGRNGERLVTHAGGEVRVHVHSQDLGDGRMVYAIQDLTSTNEAQSRIRDLAANDVLTGIANRRTFDEAVAIAAGAPTDEPTDDHCLALMMIDLDRFKPVNDTYGHGVGDEVLRRMAARFKALVSEDDLLARIGGDEFALLARLPDRAAGAALAAQMVAEASRPFDVNGITISLGASVGFAFRKDIETPLQGIDDANALVTDRLRHAADLALYAAKDAGRDTATAFKPDMARRAFDRLELEADLRTALEKGELALHYQVQQEVSSGRVVGFEALMRWNHPVRGMVPPCEFIPIAEETGLIVPLGRWALQRAAEDFASFPEGMRVSVNVSPAQFTGSDVPADVRAALAASGLDPARLELEVTEEMLIQDTDATLATLNELRALGVTLSLDDFGSGYSSLAYLTRFPFSKIKIDRVFIEHMMSDERSHQLVKSILALASSLKLRVTAEGVETHGQLLHLAKGACDEAQGYLLGKPAALDDVRNALEQARLMEEEAERLAG